jgi:CRISPR-associated exonuclease Cas4
MTMSTEEMVSMYSEGELIALSALQHLSFPVGYKRGRPKKDNRDKIQLCAQALCLEEMLG